MARRNAAPQLLLDNQLCFALYRATRAVQRSYAPHLAELGLTYPQYLAMLVLWEEEPLTVGALGERLHLDSGTLTPLLKKMEAQGFVSRQRNAADERSVIVSVTSAGEALRARAATIPERLGACLPLSKSEGETLYQLLYKVLHAIQ